MGRVSSPHAKTRPPASSPPPPLSLDDPAVADEIRRLEERRARDPRAHTFARLADLYRKDGRPERGLEVVEAGLVHHPHYLNARIVHARVLRELGRTDEAASAFRRVLEIDGENLVAKQALRELRSEGALDAIRTLRGEIPSARARPGREPGAPPNEEARTAESPNEPTGEPTEERSGDASGPGRAASGTAAARWLARLEADWREDRDEPSGAPEEDEAGSGEDGTAPTLEGPREGAADRESHGTKGVATATLAALYARQGLYEEAIGMYEKLLARDPYDARLARALQETRRLGREGGPPGGGAAPVRSRRAIPRPDPAAPAPGEGGAAPAPDRPSGPAAPDEPGRPAGGVKTIPVRDEPPTIRAFLSDLLEGRAPAPDALPEAPLARLRRWLAAAREADG